MKLLLAAILGITLFACTGPDHDIVRPDPEEQVDVLSPEERYNAFFINRWWKQARTDNAGNIYVDSVIYYAGGTIILKNKDGITTTQIGLHRFDSTYTGMYIKFYPDFYFPHYKIDSLTDKTVILIGPNSKLEYFR